MTEYTKLSELTHHVVLANCALAQGAPAWRPRIELRLVASPSALLWPCRWVPAGASYACALEKALLRPALTDAANRLPRGTDMCVWMM